MPSRRLATANGSLGLGLYFLGLTQLQAGACFILVRYNPRTNRLPGSLSLGTYSLCHCMLTWTRGLVHARTQSFCIGRTQ
ncbi:hypothetical protein FB451DRAFT_1286460, partial [Mycena latifolia]